MPSVGFELAVPTIELFQTYALDRTATRIGEYILTTKTNFSRKNSVVYFSKNYSKHINVPSRQHIKVADVCSNSRQLALRHEIG